ncbi:UDP-glucose 4-epimerase family protein [Entomomonas asaccharolytica]|uniref:SDR family oxidoreductase n=1 Tax=Entomomonas asaccharolytica TaxID=2785331 RepID=A0A974NDA9_9GAMM|nr:SDR family oxidoreductase [Entomomonas asaccharolytica]QQP84398.1 SDR family oxidoreductase [Entomomonas asaccharolytica]
MEKVLITGATGFVGQAFVKKVLADNRYTPVITVRKPLAQESQLQQFIVPDLAQPVDWSEALKNTNIVVHIAGRAHILKETATDPLQAFREVNVAATIQLAKQALEAGVKRFIFVSSIGVNGNHTKQPFTEQDTANPEGNYAISKLEAEQALWQLTKDTPMELVIIRPPLVYGEGVKANFLSLIKWVYRGIPLPLGLVKNKRSFVNVDNLVDLLYRVMEHPKAADQVFLVADGEDLSTPQLLKAVAKAMNKSANLIPIPVSCLRLMATVVGKKNIARQLCDSLQVDISKAKTLLDWQPPFSVQQGLEKTVNAFLKDKA